jgi:heptosyltransferase-2
MNVLIVRPDGIGDLVLSLPFASQLRRFIPEAHIGFLTSPVTAPILDHHPDVDYIRTVSFQAPLSDLVHAFSGGIDVAVFLKPFRRLMWAAFLARVPVRVASGSRWYSLLANRRVYEHRSDFSKHESEYNLEMLRGLGLNPTGLIYPSLEVTDTERRSGEDYWEDLPSPRVIIHPGGITARHWRPAHYRDLALELVRRGYGVVFTGSETEQVNFERDTFAGAPVPQGIRSLMGQLSIRELMSVIATAQVIVSGSTGPAHLAAALRVPNVSLFNPLRNHLPVRWKPLGRGMLLRPDVPTCDRCIGEACPYWDCLDRFTAPEVAYRVAQVLRAGQTPSSLQIIHI